MSSPTKKNQRGLRSGDDCLYSFSFDQTSGSSLMGLPAETTESQITQNRDVKKPSLTKTTNNVVSIPEKKADNHSSGTWILPVGSVQPVPMYYLLEHTSKFIQSSSSSDIAIRISECLRNLSISACYHDKKAKAKCRTDERVEFRIRIFSGIDQFVPGIIVEIQRRNGYSMAFHKDCCAILRAAEGSFENNEVAMHSSVQTFPLLKFPYVDDRTAQANFYIFIGKDEFKLVQDLLEQDRIDANVLGMQYLCSLTNFSISGSKHAKLRQSFKVIFSEDFPEIRQLVIDLVQHRRYHRKGGKIEEVDMECLDYLRDLALQVITNEFDEMATKGLLTQALKHHRWPTDHLVQCLIFDLKRSTTKPHEASLAAKCLQR
eukprot:CAMPEP_0195508042 /NCGR_PEP_ID=MMETSP0794_2-20130614/1353_1 /TAXON_ID=515487 /ORGANISM="Stephanopyxis turris, Strain CCMP 815" /LENGTH=373 /DNA_ID=CAMNT_0040634897 /DNA_START=65 /DNA_END=1186 /DNA_ORIENTATION=+